MNEQVNTSDMVERTKMDTNSPGGNPDPFIEIVPVDVALIHETPLGGGVAVVSPMEEKIVGEAPMGATISHEAPTSPYAGSSAALLHRDVSEHFRTRWNEIQGKFVDEPRSAVQQADALVSEVIGQIMQMFADEHKSLEEQWHQGNEVSTEDLRKALQSYRSFFNRLVV